MYDIIVKKKTHETLINEKNWWYMSLKKRLNYVCYSIIDKEKTTRDVNS